MIHVHCVEKTTAGTLFENEQPDFQIIKNEDGTLLFRHYANVVCMHSSNEGRARQPGSSVEALAQTQTRRCLTTLTAYVNQEELLKYADMPR